MWCQLLQPVRQILHADFFNIKMPYRKNAAVFAQHGSIPDVLTHRKIYHLQRQQAVYIFFIDLFNDPII